MAFPDTLYQDTVNATGGLRNTGGAHMSSRVLVTLSVLLFCISLGSATEQSMSEPSDEFLMSKLAVKTATGAFDLSIRLIEFTNGIRTSKRWERMSDSAWTLKTEYLDPVINEKRHYTLVFHRTNNAVALTRVSFSGHAFSDDELIAFAKRIVHNYEQHITVPK
jgi:hypothetical protein